MASENMEPGGQPTTYFPKLVQSHNYLYMQVSESLIPYQKGDSKEIPASLCSLLPY